MLFLREKGAKQSVLRLKIERNRIHPSDRMNAVFCMLFYSSMMSNMPKPCAFLLPSPVW